jgi:hypothetical protein
MTITIEKVKAKQPGWFSESNRKFFNDKNYNVVFGESGTAYLQRSTYAWTDMFGQKPKLHFRLNELNQETLEIGNLIDGIFDNLIEVGEWLDEH